MTEDQLIIAQAKLLGYSWTRSEASGGVEEWHDEDGEVCGTIPPIDHNSVAQCRALLTEPGEKQRYLEALENLVRKPGRWATWELVNSSPHDQLRAILKVKGVGV